MNHRLLLVVSILFFILVSSFSNTVSAQNTDYYNKDFLRYEDYTYVPNIRTAQLYPQGNDLLQPVLEMGTPEQLELHFDDLEGGVKNYYYTIIHCSAAWQPSNLVQPQYITGFSEDRIVTYRYSISSFQQYTHYTLLFPNDNMKPSISGNYILKVYKEGYPDQPVITKRFMIASPKVDIEVNVHRATVVENRDTRQEVDFNILTGSYRIDDPFNIMKVIITQNNRLDNAISTLKPQFIALDKLTYNYDAENTFWGGNEFREFDTRALRYKTGRVSDLYVDSTKRYRIELTPDVVRAGKPYTFINDINGRYKINVRDAITDSNVEGDYTYVKFNIPAESLIADGSIYIFGQLTNWEFNEDNKLKYNPETQSYEATLYLKQGYYNYEYVILRDEKRGGADPGFIEGNYSDTENEYTIYVYNRPIGSRYDELIGFKQFSSQNK